MSTHRGPTIATSRFPTPHTRAAWLFDFLRTDFTTIGQDEVRTLHADVIAFVEATPVGAILTSAPRRLSRLTLKRLATSVQNGIVALKENKLWELERPIRPALVRWGDRITTSYIEGSLTTLFLAGAMAIVQDTWSTLHRCPQCTALFLKVGKQQYCSPACSQHYRWQKFSKKRRTRDYRREREQAAKRQYGPNVQLSRRRKKQSATGGSTRG